MRDQIFNNNNDLVDFVFTKQVAKVFDDMVKRSVPGYQTLIEMMGLMVRTYGKNNTNYYDLGASTGAVSLSLGMNNIHKNNTIIAIDNAPEMIKKCTQNLTGKIDNFKIMLADINDVHYQNASIIILNLTLQFIPPNKRHALIKKLYQGLNKEGVLVICEKIHLNHAKQQNALERLHENFKRANGYSELEIARKRQVIEKVLITEDKETHLKRLGEVGFTQNICYFQCLNFVSFLAVK